MKIYLSFICTCLVLVPFAEAKTITVNYDEYVCNDFLDEYVFHDDTYVITWNGNKNPGCRITFDPANIDDNLCIKTSGFDISDCSVKLKFYGGLLGDELKKTYTCFDAKPDTFCGTEDGNVAIEIDDNGKLPNNPGSFKLKVYVDSSIKDVVIGLCVGGMVIAMISITVIVTIVARKRRQREIDRVLLLRRQFDFTPAIINTSSSASFPGHSQEAANKYPDYAPPPYAVAVQQTYASP